MSKESTPQVSANVLYSLVFVVFVFTVSSSVCKCVHWFYDICLLLIFSSNCFQHGRRVWPYDRVTWHYGIWRWSFANKANAITCPAPLQPMHKSQLLQPVLDSHLSALQAVTLRSALKSSETSSCVFAWALLLGKTFQGLFFAGTSLSSMGWSHNATIA